jgi:penicillin G amidase
VARCPLIPGRPALLARPRGFQHSGGGPLVESPYDGAAVIRSRPPGARPGAHAIPTPTRAGVPLLVVLLLLVAVGCNRTPEEPRDFDELARTSLATIDGTVDVPGLREEVRVLRDEWGIPHIYARNRDDLFFAQGWVQAQDRLWQIDMWRRVNEGRLAEILGPDAFEHDRLARLIMFRGPWDEEWPTYHPEGEQIFRAFSDGVNAYIDQIGDHLPVEYRLTGLRPLPWTPQASTGRVATALPLGAARAELALAREVAELGVAEVNRRRGPLHANWIELAVPEGLDLSIISEEVVEALSHFRGEMPQPPLLPRFEAWEGAVASANSGAQERAPGSNNWVVAPRLTATGHVLLANDPHRGVSNPSLRYLVHLDAPDYRVIGATEPAIPGVAIGHNGRVAWGLTIVGTDQADVFVETLNPENLDEALWKGEWYPLRIVVDTIPVRGEAARVVEHRFSRHGPVFHVDSLNQVAYAVRSTANEPGTGGYLGALRLAEVDDCGEFLDELAHYYAPSENMICGDAEGNIAWLAAALTPRRSGGWHGRLPVPGTGDHGWDGFRPHTELPQEMNPDRGWLGTANHDVQPPGYDPPIMFRPGPFPRWERLQQMFARVAPGELTADAFETMILDAVHPWWERDDRPLLDGWRADEPDVEWARSELEAWDGVYDRASRGAALHNAFRRHLDAEARGAATPAGRRRDLVRDALEASLAELTERLGGERDEWRWGRIHRSEFPHLLVGAYDLPAVERSGGGGTVAATGATFREIIDFSELDRSRATSAPGQSMQPGSPFYGNLLPLWAEGEFFPLLFTREAVEAGADHELVLRPGG